MLARLTAAATGGAGTAGSAGGADGPATGSITEGVGENSIGIIVLTALGYTNLALSFSASNVASWFAKEAKRVLILNRGFWGASPLIVD